jgi:hypothetical protein
MNSSKKIRDEEVVMLSRFKKVKCRVKIIEKSAESTYKVIVGVTNDENYIGISTTNYFENFALFIKQKFLQNINHDSIEWVDHMSWKDKSFPDRLVNVSMDYTKNKYSNPSWGGLYIE